MAPHWVAMRLLFHPTSPDPEPLHRLLVSKNGPEAVFILSGHKSKPKLKAAVDVLRGAYLLHVLGHVDKAEVLEEAVQLYVPDAWHWRERLYAEFARDPKLQHLDLHGTRKQARHDKPAPVRVSVPVWR